MFFETAFPHVTPESARHGKAETMAKSSTEDDLHALNEKFKTFQRDPKNDGTLFGAGGFFDQQQGKWLAVGHFWRERFPNIEFTFHNFRAWLASEGIPPLKADRRDGNESTGTLGDLRKARKKNAEFLT